MKRYLSVAILSTLFLLPISSLAVSPVKSIKIYGETGKRIDDCINQRVKAQDVDELVDVFAKQDEVNGRWASEFWGKWVQGAIASWQYTHDAELYKLIQYSVNKMISYQLPDGYIGDYDKDHQLHGWDVWGRKYTLLGLIKWYRISGDKKALKSAQKLLDYTMQQIGEGKAHIYDCGRYKGMAPSSILEPVMFLYNETKQPRYLDFAKWIVADGESAQGPQLIAKADVPVNNRFPAPYDQNWSRDNGQKAYEMMSCYVGLLELSKVLHRQDYVDATEKVVKHIMDEEINICGSGAANEVWYGGKLRQTIPAYNMMETCVSFTWMQINERLFEMTGKSVYADNIEQTFFNALLASMKNDASMIVKYVPLEGVRVEGEHQCGVNINCCSANGPRAFAMIPRMAYSVPSAQELNVNIYAPSLANVNVGGTDVQIEQITTYPVDGGITLQINPLKSTNFTVALRIPEWSKVSTVKVNGEEQQGVKAGSYFKINRTWQKNDRIDLAFDMRTRATEINHMVALQRGPITLARDSRFQDGFVDECCDINPDKDGYVETTPVTAPKGMWMAFELTARTGAYRDDNPKRAVHFCDFASAGNTWEPSIRYRVWIPRQINVLYEPR